MVRYRQNLVTNVSKALWMLVVLCVTLLGCTPQLYDMQTEQSVTGLQRSVEQFLVKLERNPASPTCLYSNHEAFYDVTEVELSALQVRNRARVRNDLTTRQLRLLDDSLETLEELHQTSSCISAVQIEPLKRNFNSIFTAILTLELAKKRGG